MAAGAVKRYTERC